MSGVESLLQDIDTLSPLTVGLVVLAGLVVGIAPSSFPLLAVAAGLGTRDAAEAGTGRSHVRGAVLSLGFVAGIVTVDVAIGALFGFAGFAVMRVLNAALAYVYALLAALLTLTGLALWRVIRFRIPVLRPGTQASRTFAGAACLGLAFGLSTCPACTPMILPVVVAAASTADPVLGAMLMGAFGLARGVPVVVAGTSAASLTGWLRGRQILTWAERVGGALLIAAAAYFAWQAGRYAGWY